MSAELLRPACVLAFAVAREGSEAADPVEPPAAMRSFLYVDELPRRAIAAAQQAVEESSDFRYRVASRADEEAIGRAGYLWLQRPTGWAVEFEALANAADGDDEDLPSTIDPEVEAVYRGLTSEPIELIIAQPPEPEPAEEFRPSTPPDLDRSIASVSPIGAPGLDLPNRPGQTTFPTSASLGLAAVTNTEHAHQIDPPPGVDDAQASPMALAEADDGFEAADALESELDSLRGLVARLANEREVVDASEPHVPEIDTTGELPVVESAMPAPQELVDTDGLRSDLETAHHELYLAQADLTIVRQEREESQRLQSEALKRQVQLEKELATVRELKADLETELSTSQAKAISVEERYNRVEGQLSELDREREAVKAQLETMTLERNQIRDERAALRAERDDLRARADDLAEKTGGVDIVELMASHRSTTSELENTSRELARIIGQAEQYEDQLTKVTEEATSLKSERIDLRARLGETETALDVTTTQFDALKIDSERMAAELGALRAERDGLQGQLAELQTGLSEVLDEAAESRQRNDTDRRSLNELRVEHDVLSSRLADLEVSEAEVKAKAETLTVERDNLLAGRDELLEERGQLRGELATLAGERGSAHQQLGEAQERVRSFEAELHMERRQREELGNRLLVLDDTAERTAVEQQALTDERDSLVALVERLESELSTAADIRVERDELAAQQVSTKRVTDEATAVSAAQLDEAKKQAEQLGAARAEIEAQLAEVSDQAGSLRARLAEVEQERDGALAGRLEAAGDADTMRGSLDTAEREIEDLRSEILAIRRQADDSTVALQVKEGELRTVLSARNADADEMDRLKSSLAEVTAKAEQAESTASAMMGPLAEADARSDELAATRSELDEANSELSQANVDLSQANVELDQASSDLNQASSDLNQASVELDQANVELDQLRNELAAARVELASTTAELEAKEAVQVDSGPVIPPVVIDDVDPADGSDELDSMAAEVRSALRGPSMLDTIAGGSDLPELGADTDQAEVDFSDAPRLPDEGLVDGQVGGPVDGMAERLDAAESEPVVDDVEDPLAAAVAEVVASEDTGALSMPTEVPFEPDLSGSDFDPATGPVPVPDYGDDDLDAVSELIAQTVSEFGPGDGLDLERQDDDHLDLTAELTRLPSEPGSDEFEDSAGMGTVPPSILGEAPDSLIPAEPPDLNVPRADGSKRRRIQVPGDIVDDEVAVARFVVSSPDVVLLVDGDSVAELGWPSLPVAQRRDALVTYLADLSASTRAAPDVVFDGRLGDDDSLPASRAVRIRLSTPPTPPTAALDELVDAYPEQWPIALVTDDSDLAATAGDRGAAVLNNGQLLDLFIAE